MTLPNMEFIKFESIITVISIRFGYPFFFFCVPLCYLSLSIIEVCYVKVKFM